jgi:hypothetical protein
VRSAQEAETVLASSLAEVVDDELAVLACVRQEGVVPSRISVVGADTASLL